MPLGRPAIEEVRALWRQERVPQGTQLQEELSSEICAARTSSPSARSVQVAELKAAKERADAEKGKKDRAGSIRTWNVEEYSPGHVRRAERDVQTVTPVSFTYKARRGAVYLKIEQ